MLAHPPAPRTKAPSPQLYEAAENSSLALGEIKLFAHHTISVRLTHFTTIVALTGGAR